MTPVLRLVGVNDGAGHDHQGFLIRALGSGFSFVHLLYSAAAHAAPSLTCFILPSGNSATAFP